MTAHASPAAHTIRWPRSICAAVAAFCGYNIMLTITDSSGRLADVCRTVTVCGRPNGFPCGAPAP